MADVERLLGASHPSEVLALRESFSNGLDASLAITALEAIAASAERTAVERDLRFAQLLF
ncbi:Potassium channel AKT2, partial [Durusdinium trenchii]